MSTKWLDQAVFRHPLPAGVGGAPAGSLSNNVYPTNRRSAITRFFLLLQHFPVRHFARPLLLKYSHIFPLHLYFSLFETMFNICYQKVETLFLFTKYTKLLNINYIKDSDGTYLFMHFHIEAIRHFIVLKHK